MGRRVTTTTTPTRRLGASRTQVLGLVAGGMVVVLVLAQLGPAVAVPTAAPSGSTAAAVDSSPAALPGAPLEIGAAALRTRYEPIAKAGPFRVRSFRPAPPPRPEAPRPRDERPRERYSPPPDPKVLELRLTGFMGEGDRRVAILEEPMGQGRGILAKKGDALGAAQVADITTDSLVIVHGEKRTTITFADPTVSLPLEAAPRVAAFMPESQLNMAGGVAGNSSLTTTGSSGGGGVVLADDEKRAVLERLKARRAGANAAATGAPAPPAPPGAGAPPPAPPAGATPPASPPSPTTSVAPPLTEAPPGPPAGVDGPPAPPEGWTPPPPPESPPEPHDEPDAPPADDPNQPAGGPQ